MPTPKRNVRSPGAAAVEFALVLPLLLLVVLGGIDWGVYFYRAQVVTNAAREGARAGSLEINDASLAETNARMAAATYLTNGQLVATQATITAQATAGAISVEIVYPAGSITGFTEIVLPATMRARAEMRR